MMNCDLPLVSVVVVCYNAEKYVLETLESVKAQSYNNLELIVSDDCSRDKTVEIARGWISENQSRFVRTEIVTIDHNTGVSANYNRAIQACSGVWVKNVDGDDLLTENCISDNVRYVNANPQAEIVFSNAYVFKGSNEKEIIGSCIPDDKLSFFSLDAQEQFKSLLSYNLLPSQTCFIKTSLLKSHPYNEKYPALEDYPMWVTLTKNGHKVFYLNDYTAYYRKDESMTYGNKRFFSIFYVQSLLTFFWNEMYDDIKKYNLKEAYNENRKYHLLIDFACGFLGNKKTKLSIILYKLARKYIEKRVYYDL